MVPTKKPSKADELPNPDDVLRRMLNTPPDKSKKKAKKRTRSINVRRPDIKDFGASEDASAEQNSVSIQEALDSLIPVDDSHAIIESV